MLAQTLFIGRALQRGHGWYVIKALALSACLLPKKLTERHHIQSTRKVSPDYIWNIMTHDLPPNAHNLRQVRKFWWKLKGKA
jgi:hypothetical protein